MTKQAIKYVGFYDVKDSKSDRVSNLAAINKMNYISDVLVEAGYDVEFVSPSWIGKGTLVKYEKQNTLKLDQNKSITFCPSWKTKHKVTDYIKIIFSLLWLFFYLIINVKKEEKIIAYHVQWISLPIRAAKMIKRFNLILEVEEIYQDVFEHSKLFTIWERKLLNTADSYIYSTDLLKNKLNKNKPNVIIYGEYNNYPKLANNNNNNNNIRLLYAGVIDSHKKGAFNALEAAKYLPGNYELRIIGFGEINKLKKDIKEHNKKYTCQVYYDGLKSGNDYIKYCQTFDIGLSTQSMEGEYLESSFPSKILSYLSLGLRVVSGNIKCVSVSKIGNLVSYYLTDNPKNISETIQKVNVSSDFNGAEVLEKLHLELVNDMKKLIMEN